MQNIYDNGRLCYGMGYSIEYWTKKDILPPVEKEEICNN